MSKLECARPEDKVFLTVDNLREDLVRGIHVYFGIAKQLRGLKVGQQAHGSYSLSKIMKMASAHGINEFFADTNFAIEEPELMANAVTDAVKSYVAPSYLSIHMASGEEAIAAAGANKNGSKLIVSASTPALSLSSSIRLYNRTPDETVKEATRMAFDSRVVDGIMFPSRYAGAVLDVEQHEYPYREGLIKIGTGISLPGEPRYNPDVHTTPQEALGTGVDILAIGRLITTAAEPEAMAERILVSIS